MHSLWTATPHMKYLCVLGKEPLAKRSYAKSICICMAPSMHTDCNKASHLKGRHLTKIDSTKTCSNHGVALTFNFKQNGFHNLLGLSMHETFYKGQPNRACWQSWPMGALCHQAQSCDWLAKRWISRGNWSVSIRAVAGFLWARPAPEPERYTDRQN